MEIDTRNFGALQLRELYELLKLRSEVFVVEQECIYQDVDGKDQQALHVLGWEGEELVAYTRIFGPGVYFEEASIGRVAVKLGFRGKGYAKQIMAASIDAVYRFFGKEPIALSAQQYLEQFYTDLGFTTEGSSYLEDGIPHIRMVMYPSP